MKHSIQIAILSLETWSFSSFFAHTETLYFPLAFPVHAGNILWYL